LAVYNLLKDVEVEYIIAAGKPVVRLKSGSHLKHRAIYGGTAQLLFHWVQEGKTQAWKFEPSIPEPKLVLAEETSEGGAQLLAMTLDEILPATGVIKDRMQGVIAAPAVHMDVPWGYDIWMFLIRSPWFQFRQRIDRTTLSVEHESGRAVASISPTGTGGISVELSVSGTSFKKASIAIKRTIGQFTSDEFIGEAQAGAQTFSWYPIMRSFDLCLVTHATMNESQFVDLMRGLGASVSSGILGGGTMQGDFVLCDGPSMGYSVVLTGDSGFLEHPHDETGVTLTW
jgi:hypothetical protein